MFALSPCLNGEAIYSNLGYGTTYKPVRPPRTIEEEEEVAMAEAMADALEDDRLDNSDDLFH